MLSPEELARYARHISLPEFGLPAQQRLKEARVLVVGAGGLGSPLLLYLAAAGVGHIGIVDFDVVDTSNLQRQVLYTMGDVGQKKAEVARRRLLQLNPHLDVALYDTRLDSGNALDVISSYDVVADGTDNFPTRYLVNDACLLAGKVNVYASIFRFQGQLSVFNYLKEDGSRGPNYRHLFPEPPPPDSVPNCAEGGVLGVLPGIIGSLQASEVIKVVTGVGEPLAGRLFLFDAATFQSRTLKISGKQAVKVERLMDYDAFCGLKTEPSIPIREISPHRLAEMKAKGEPHFLLDVREPFEYAADHIGGTLIPQATVVERRAEIPRKGKVVVHCKSGRRSAQVIRKLQSEFGFDNLYNLKGGLLAYRQKTPPT